MYPAAWEMEHDGVRKSEVGTQKSEWDKLCRWGL